MKKEQEQSICPNCNSYQSPESINYLGDEQYNCPNCFVSTPDTWTITATFTVFAGDMERNEVIAKAQEDLNNLVDGSDYIGGTILDAKRDEF